MDYPRRDAKSISKNIEQAYKDTISENASEKGMKRTSLILMCLLCEILLDIREHIDGIEAGLP